MKRWFPTHGTWSFGGDAGITPTKLAALLTLPAPLYLASMGQGNTGRVRTTLPPAEGDGW
jgi:hypothetical protein